MIITISPTMTRLLNALHHNLELDHEWEEFQRERDQILTWLRRESAFVPPAESADYANLEWLWEKVDRSLETEDLAMDSLARPLVEAASLYQRLRAERRSHGLAENETVNSALLAVRAFLEGRVDLETLSVWAEPLDAYLNSAWERGLRVGIPSSQQGLTALEVGIRDWKTALAEGNRGTEHWEAVSSWIRWGADQIEEYLASLEPGPMVPFESLLKSLRKPASGEESVAGEEESVEDLHDLWLELLDPLVLTLSARERLEAEMETILNTLAEAVRSQDTAQRASALDSAQELCHATRRQYAELGQPGANLLLVAVSAVLSEKMPDVLLEDLLGHSEEGSRGATLGTEQIRRYLADGDRSQLHQAMDMLLKPVFPANAAASR